MTRAPFLLAATALAVVMSVAPAGDAARPPGRHRTHMAARSASTPPVQAAVETDPVASAGDAADDSVIWVDEGDPGRSTVIGTDKAGGSLNVYDLQGHLLHEYPGIRPNNVDLRTVGSGRSTGAVVAASDAAGDAILLYRVDPRTRGLTRVDVRPIRTGHDAAGLCMYRSPTDGSTYVFVGDNSGTWEQWRLVMRGARIDASRVRTLRLDSTSEGCVADDALGRLFVSEESKGIWQIDPEPPGTAAPRLVDGVGARLVPDVEGLTLYERGRGEGYLIASSQGSDRFAVYERTSLRPVGTFHISEGAVDEVTHTDGIAATSAALPDHPFGLFVAQDDHNDGANQNFKLVSWTSIARAFSPPLVPVPASTGPTTYYVDDIAGSDGNDGTDPSRAWRSLGRANRAALGPGDRVALRRGGSWRGPLHVAASGTGAAPITVSGFGSGPRPRISGASTCVEVTGDHVVIEGLHADACSWAGISVAGRSDRIEGSRVSGNAAGIYVKDSGVNTVISGNEVVDNDKMSVNTPEPGGDSGAFGILLAGIGSDVFGNTISGSDAFSYDYGRDGAAVELHGARRSTIHHNVAIDNDTFTELGEASTGGNTFSFNVVRSSLESSTFLVTRGGGSHGPVLGTTVTHNTALLTGARSQGVVCHSGCGPDILRMRSNIVQAGGTVLYADGAVDEDDDVLFGAKVHARLGPGTVVADPRFRDPSAGDLRLRAGSPAIDLGAEDAARRDADGAPMPRDGDGDGRAAPDAGAFELQP